MRDPHEVAKENQQRREHHIDDTNIGWIVHDKTKNKIAVYADQYKVFFDKKEMEFWLKKIGWDFKGIASSMGISETPGMVSMQAGGDFEIMIIPFELYTKGM